MKYAETIHYIADTISHTAAHLKHTDDIAVMIMNVFEETWGEHMHAHLILHVTDILFTKVMVMTAA